MNKDALFNNLDKGKLMEFLQFDRTGQILNLFNEENINLLKKSYYKEDIICYILTYSKYANELFENQLFLDVFLNSNITSYYGSMRNLKKETYDLILNSIDISSKESVFINLISYFPVEYILNLLDSWPYKKDILYNLLGKNTAITNKIISKYNIDLTHDKIDMEYFIIGGKESYYHALEQEHYNDTLIETIEIPSSMITNELCDKMWKENDIFKLRMLINDMIYITDTTKINNYIKQKEDEIFLRTLQSDIISPFLEIFNAFSKTKNSKSEDEFYYNQKEYIKLCRDIDEYIFSDMGKIFENEGIIGVENYMKKLSSNMISNYIIDYHFEENFHNIMIDINELLNFYYSGNINLSEEKLELYQKISNIDYLEKEEKIELHNKLKNYNIMEMFYDDIIHYQKKLLSNIKMKNYQKNMVLMFIL